MSGSTTGTHCLKIVKLGGEITPRGSTETLYGMGKAQGCGIDFGDSGATLALRVELRNPGGAAARRVRVRVLVPAGLGAKRSVVRRLAIGSGKARSTRVPVRIRSTARRTRQRIVVEAQADGRVVRRSVWIRVR